MNDELRSRIGRLAETHDIAPLTADQVIARRRTGVLRHRLLAVAAVLLLVAGVVGVIVVTGDDPDVDVAGVGDGDGDDGEGITVEGVEGTVGPGAENTDGDDLPPAVEDAAPAPTTTLAMGGPDEIGLASGGSDWIVPWGDGFLSIGSVFVPSEVGFEELVPDARDLFPEEIIDAVESAGATTLEEQIEAITEAGLLDLATEILTESPELLAAYNEVQAGGTFRFAALVSDDGETWTEVPGFALPGGQDWAQQVATDGTHLVVALQVWEEETPTSHVAITTDLTDWTVVDLPPAETTPDHVTADTWVNGLAVGDDGWLATVMHSSYIDLWSLMPASVFEELDALGVGYGFEGTEDGVAVLVYDDGGTTPATTTTTVAPPETTVPAPAEEAEYAEDPVATEPAAPFVPVEPTIHAVVPWSELPLTYDEFLDYEFGRNEIVGYRGDFAGSLSVAEPPATVGDCCTLVGTDAGFLLQGWNENGSTIHVSPDAQEWTAASPPAGAEWVGSLAAVDGGVVLVDQDGVVWRGDPDGTGWEQAEIPDLPDNAHLWFVDNGGRGLATVIDVAIYDDVAIDVVGPVGDAVDEASAEYRPDFWLVATVDGITWHVEDLADDPNNGYSGLGAVNGGRAVVRTWNGDWHAFDIG